MSVIPYWRERLEEGRPIRLDTYWEAEFDWRNGVADTSESWPRMVACQAFWMDYQAWFEDVYLVPYRESAYFKDFPDQMPKPESEGGFWSQFGPMVYINRKTQRRGYFVWGQKKYEDEWVKVKVYRSFIRMASHKECLAQLELILGAKDPMARIDIVAGALRRMRRQTEENKMRLPKVMRNPRSG